MMKESDSRPKAEDSHVYPTASAASDSEAELIYRSCNTPSPQSNSHSSRDTTIHDLAKTLFLQFDSSKDEETITKVINLYQEALDLRPPGHPLRDHTLHDLATALVGYFELVGGLEKLESALVLYCEALELRRPGHPLWETSFTGYDHAYRIQQDQLDEAKLDKTLHHYRKTLEECPPNHPRRDFPLQNLGVAYWYRFSFYGKMEDLMESIRLLREALALRPKGHPFRESTLNILAVVLIVLSEEVGKDDPLNEAIELLYELLELRPHGHPLRSGCINNLAIALKSRCEQTGNSLSEVIRLHRESLLMRPPGHPDRDCSLHNLAHTLLSEFDIDGSEDLLSEAISVFTEVLELRPVGHPDHCIALKGLGVALMFHFRWFGNENTLMKSISLLRESLLYFPPDHPTRAMVLADLADALSDHGDIPEAASFYQQAIASYPPHHIHRASCIHGYANNVLDQFKASRDMKKQAEAVRLYQESLALRQPTDPHRFCTLCGLANALYAGYEGTGNDQDLSNIISLYQQVCTNNKGHLEERAVAHCRLASILFKMPQSKDSWHEAVQCIDKALSDPFCTFRNQLDLVTEAVYAMEVPLGSTDVGQEQLSEALKVYLQVIELLPKAAHLGLDLPSRLRSLKGTEHICRMAAIRALAIDRPNIAVEVLEEGRLVFWAQSLHLRARTLDVVDDAEGEKLRTLLRRLEYGNSASHASYSSSPIGLEQHTEKQHRLNTQVQDMLKEIRARPGLERFMRIQSFEFLSAAASHGPVVILVSTDIACFALAITDTVGTHKTIPLSGITPGLLHKFRIGLKSSATRDGAGALSDDGDFSDDGDSKRLGMSKQRPGVANNAPSSHVVFAELWKKIVNPIVESLGLQRAVGRDRPRIHWCPVGDFTFLPLHAAGIYTSNNICAADYFVSSYTPSLSSLINARKNFSSVPREQLKALLVAEPSAPGYRPLPQVADEANAVEDLWRLSSITSNVNIAPSVQTVLDALPEAHILHLACHGIQQADPLESHFALRDGPLSIAALTKLELPNAVLAFLSACETAKGDENQPDQAIHLAASLLFCGFRSVIGTMWTMHDQDGPVVAKKVYDELLQSDSLELGDIPYALDAAVRELRARGAPPTRWATFVHMGA